MRNIDLFKNNNNNNNINNSDCGGNNISECCKCHNNNKNYNYNKSATTANFDRHICGSQNSDIFSEQITSFNSSAMSPSPTVLAATAPAQTPNLHNYHHLLHPIGHSKEMQQAFPIIETVQTKPFPIRGRCI